MHIRRRKGPLAGAAGLVTVALAGTTMAGAPAASAAARETVIVTASGLLSPVAAVDDVFGTVLTQFQIIDGVAASIPAALEPVLAALPGITVTPTCSVSVQSTVESTGPHTPSDAFLQQTGATQLARGRRHRPGRHRGRDRHRHRRPARLRRAARSAGST